MFEHTNYTMLLDFYELTMANGYFASGKKDEIAYFDVFFRDIPDGGGYAIAAGLDEVIDYIKNLKFTEDDIINEKEIEVSVVSKPTCPPKGN